MEFTPKPRFQNELPVQNLSDPQFLVVAIETAKQLSLDIKYANHRGFIANTNFNVFQWNAKITLLLESGRAYIQSESMGNRSNDQGRNEKLVKQFEEVLVVTQNNFTREELLQKFEMLEPKFDSFEEDDITLSPPTFKENVAELFSFVTPGRKYVVTPVIVYLNIFIFLLMGFSGVNVLDPDRFSLIKWGANYGPKTLNAEWWRLITSCFLHGSLIHIALNMFALIYIGLLVEPYIGKARFLMAYCITGILASLTSVMWHPLVSSVGASGAIMGIYGVFISLLVTNVVDVPSRATLLPGIVLLVVLNLLGGMTGPVDNAAHIGGLFSGIIIGFIFHFSLKKAVE